jgi:hypothetical protein
MEGHWTERHQAAKEEPQIQPETGVELPLACSCGSSWTTLDLGLNWIRSRFGPRRENEGIRTEIRGHISSFRAQGQKNGGRDSRGELLRGNPSRA